MSRRVRVGDLVVVRCVGEESSDDVGTVGFGAEGMLEIRGAVRVGVEDFPGVVMGVDGEESRAGWGDVYRTVRVMLLGGRVVRLMSGWVEEHLEVVSEG